MNDTIRHDKDGGFTVIPLKNKLRMGVLQEAKHREIDVMRELKFDIIFWDSINPKTIEHISIEEAYSENYIEFKNNTIIPTDECTIIRQFTGLQDKNGTDIYEGDIMEFKNDLGRHNLHKVFRVDGGLVINSHSDDISRDSIVFYEACADMQTSQGIRQCEIIGNIHETILNDL